MDPVIRIDARGATYLGKEGYLAGEEYSDGTIVSMVPGSPSERVCVEELVVIWLVFRDDPGYQSILEPETARVGAGVRISTTREERAPW